MECWKKGYDKLGAKMALSRCLNSRKGNRGERRYYKCPHCGKYHLTSQRK